MILALDAVLAQLIPGHQFYGSVTYNGQPAPDGLLVVAKIEGEEVASITTKNGEYGLGDLDGDGDFEIEETFIIEDPNNDLCVGGCPTVNFFVNGEDTGQTKIFNNGGVTQLDLTATGPSVATTTTPQNGGGGGGGGGGGIVTTTTIAEETTTTVEKCQEKWTCTEWSACENKLQTRTCTDESECGTDLYKPFESQPCSTLEEETAGPITITGLVALLTSTTGLGLITIIIVLIAIIVFLIKKRMSKKELSTEEPSTENPEEIPTENPEEPSTEVIEEFFNNTPEETPSPEVPEETPAETPEEEPSTQPPEETPSPENPEEPSNE